MRKNVTMNELSETVNSLRVGESFYANAIGFGLMAIELLKVYIKLGVITPDRDELNAMIKPEAQQEFIKGNAIAPQMTYIKIKEVE